MITGRYGLLLLLLTEYNEIPVESWLFECLKVKLNLEFDGVLLCVCAALVKLWFDGELNINWAQSWGVPI